MEKEIALKMIDSRLVGIAGTLSWHASDVAEYEHSKTMAHNLNYEPRIINEDALLQEKARLEAARADVESWSD